MSSSHYRKAPITEALIDFRVNPAPGLTAVDIAAGLLKHMTSEYPERQEIPSEQRLQLTFRPSFSPEVNYGPALSGFRYVSADGRRIFQARVEGFTFSLLCDPVSEEKRYEHWSLFRNDAYKLWEVYRRVCNPIQITRAAIRYVNRFDLPGPPLELRDYFTVYPQEPVNLGHHDLASFGLQLVIPQPDIEAVTVLNQGLILAPIQGAISIVLDIDLFRENLSWDASNSDTVWEYMEKLHVKKNEVFEACITDLTREVIR